MNNTIPTRSEKSRQSTKRRKKKRLLITLGVILLVLVISFLFRKQLVVLVFDLFFAQEIKQTLDQKSYQPLVNEPAEVPDKNPLQEPFSLLLIGNDQRKNEPSRADTLIYTIIRPQDNRMLLISIPRDTYADIIGTDRKSKINSAYSHGGAQMTVDTVQSLFQHPVNYYASINFMGLVDVVDTLEGVELPIDKDIVNKQKDHEKFTIRANQPIYYGVDALNYVRYREDSDFKRTERQRFFISALLNRFKKLENIGKIDDLITIGGDNLQTNMKSDMLLSLAKSVMLTQPSITNYMLQGEGARKDGAYVYYLDTEDLNHVIEKIDIWLKADSAVGDLSFETNHSPD